jgi:predicted transcriptional regulator
MPQLQLPVFPEGLTLINEDLAFQREDGQVVYFHGLMPVFQHEEKDLRSFRMFTSQLIANGTVRQRDIVQAFGVPLATVKRYMKVHREQGAAGFFRTPRRRSASVLTEEVKQCVQALLDEGESVPQVSLAVGVAGNTLHKAIRAGRLHEFKKNGLRTRNGPAPRANAARSTA